MEIDMQGTASEIKDAFAKQGYAVIDGPPEEGSADRAMYCAFRIADITDPAAVVRRFEFAVSGKSSRREIYDLQACYSDTAEPAIKFICLKD